MRRINRAVAGASSGAEAAGVPLGRVGRWEGGKVGRWNGGTVKEW